ncbi:LytR/AlgR family response regulator transcription factor [Spirosoma rhododendri]|uniref:Response regulator transcription factor n=1 Tax=Spirosoma rhododendri TaxID=2728024 RepID=A0A7L5DMP3_9BACT|nr:LytTR family DNA-binding domain-containing protein [Spirosoma rhododendri]QJD79676.1 response regulator transcription factor [Spirosoma rhododendri]
MILTSLIIDDEFLSRRSLERLCNRHENVAVLGSFDNAWSALRFLDQHPVDLLWLDVEMPGLSGFDMLKRLDIDPLVVLTTVKTDYAFDAYQHEVVDYLKKPIDWARFSVSVDRVLDRYRLRQTTPPVEPALRVRVDGQSLQIPPETIEYIENVGDYVRIVTETQSCLVYMTMKSLEDSLSDGFVRVHRSYIINLRKIVDIEENTLVIGNKVIPISRANKAELLKRLNLL